MEPEGGRRFWTKEGRGIMFQRVWQVIMSVLGLGGFFAVQYMRGRDVDPLALTICSWAAVVAPVLLAIVWVTKKLYFRAFFLAVLIVLIRISLVDSLSEFLRTAAWFSAGAIVLALIVAVVARWARRGAVSRPAAASQAAPQVASQVAPAAEHTLVRPPAKAANGQAPTAAVTPMQFAEAPGAKAGVAGRAGEDPAETVRCDKCGAIITEDAAVFCPACGATLS